MQISASGRQFIAASKTNSAKSRALSGKGADTTPAVPHDQVALTRLSAATSAPKSKAMAQAATDSAVQVAVGAVPGPLAQPTAEAFKSGFVDDYLTPAQIRERCESLQKEYPNLVQLVETGIKTHGYDGKNKDVQGPADLFYLRIGPQTPDRDNKVGIFQYAAPHARERVNPMSMMELTEELVKNYDPGSTDPKVQENTRLMDKLDIFIAINTNPDGHNYVIYDDPDWRKNRMPLGNGEHGVDINRNYPYQWEKSDRPSSEVYSGAGPASEAETQAIMKVTKDHPNILFQVDWHSYSEEIRRPKGVSEVDSKFYDTMHGRVQKAMEKVAGHRYQTTVSEITNGSSDDYFYNTEGILSTVMETGKQFIPERSEAVTVMKESVAGAREFLRVASEL